ncbi:hypothetical protein A5707_22695 [Mycobacterium kyorinense]|uniref:Mce protein n=1 Tax=Mycobacterium kyorinense TaxID=487514 RepID=A0A1A2Z8Y5_9MYCO|nr:hypothetical protein [Mycobacterium kyorinense]OBI45977.1 hypothetical protein A5707_22695 [Mycobacterium kyorinense]
MEGDAGTSRLNPTDADESSSTEVTAEDSQESEVGADQTSSEVTAEDSQESEVGADQTSSGVTAEDSQESEVGAEEATVEAPQPTGEDDESATGTEPDTESSVDAGNPSRLGRRWLVGIAATLVVLAAGLGAGGYFALRSHLQSKQLARNDIAAVQAAKDCVSALNAPDTAAMAASQQKIIECSTGAFGTQAALYSSMLADAYQAANVTVQMSDMRAAVERNNDDGSINVLVATRVKVTNSDATDREVGYRMRATMESADGQFKISKLDLVTK